MAIIQKLFGDTNQKEIKKLQKHVERIRAKEQEISHLDAAGVKNRIAELKQEIASVVEAQKSKVAGIEEQMYREDASPDPVEKKELKRQHELAREKLHQLYQDALEARLVETFALVGQACRLLKGTTFEVRGKQETWEIEPYDVQYLGGIVLHQGKIAEMRTGEGKTFVASLPLILNALTGEGAHLVTVNEYLALYHAGLMGYLYEFLGLSVGVIVSGMQPQQKREAYASDITYGTNNEFGFDYLRDNMAVEVRQMVQRDLHYAIVDEVDSILIDEARTPLIVSAPRAESTEKYYQYSQLVRQLEENTHYNIDEKQKTALLTEEGVARMEQLMGVENIYTSSGFKEVHHIEQALKAHALFKKDRDYVVVNDEIQIVDEFTGRILYGRRYSQGLHQAIEAKEQVDVKQESMTLASITFQNLFRMYDKLSGMTGTALTEAAEFGKIYNLEVISIPTNRPIARIDKPDAIFMNERGKYSAIVQKVKDFHEKGQPVLIGTISIERSERLSDALKRAGIPHSVLNAKYHEQEAEIIADAGQKGAVTIATNMAGRGTDIKVPSEVKELGGLVVIGTERHESRRIDNQLRGRSGRQGDPGESQFFISMDDDLMRIFGGDRMKAVMATLKVPEDLPIENKLISRQIEGAQRKVETHHYDMRETVVKFDDVLNKHREIVYARRRRILKHKNLRAEVLEMAKEFARHAVLVHTSSNDHTVWDFKEIAETMNTLYHDASLKMTEEQLEDMRLREEVIEAVESYVEQAYALREQQLPEVAIMRRLERSLYLRAIDVLWMEHLENMNYLRSGVSLRGYGQRDPLVEYKNEAFRQFEELLSGITANVVQTIYKVDLTQFVPRAPEQKPETDSRDIPDPDHKQAAPEVVVTNQTDVEDTLYSSDIAMADVQKKQVQVIQAGQATASSSSKEVIGEDGVRLTRKEKKRLEKEQKK